MRQQYNAKVRDQAELMAPARYGKLWEDLNLLQQIDLLQELKDESELRNFDEYYESRREARYGTARS
jgi:Zn-finger domain-containing protein